MRVLVVGTGSVGRRHLANLLSLGVQPLAYSYRAAEAAVRIAGAFGDAAGGVRPGFLPASPGIGADRVPLVADWRAALERVDAVVVANRTDQHMEVALQAARRGLHLFIEKPLGADLRHIDALVQEVRRQGLVVECGFMLRTHPNLVWMREQLRAGRLGELMHARAAVGQWLPDWRPGTDHRRSYGAFRHLGGGVVLDLIHELDLVQWLLAPAREVVAMTRQVDCLEIETEAIAQVGLRLAGGLLAQVHLDYVRPGYGRELEVVGRLGVLSWSYGAGTVSLDDGREPPRVVHRVPEGFERNTLFRSHMARFLQRVKGESFEAISPLEEAVQVMRTAMAVHASAEQRRVVEPAELIDPAQGEESVAMHAPADFASGVAA